MKVNAIKKDVCAPLRGDPFQVWHKTAGEGNKRVDEKRRHFYWQQCFLLLVVDLFAEAVSAIFL